MTAAGSDGKQHGWAMRDVYRSHTRGYSHEDHYTVRCLCGKRFTAKGKQTVLNRFDDHLAEHVTPRDPVPGDIVCILNSSGRVRYRDAIVYDYDERNGRVYFRLRKGSSAAGGPTERECGPLDVRLTGRSAR